VTNHRLEESSCSRWFVTPRNTGQSALKLDNAPSMPHMAAEWREPNLPIEEDKAGTVFRDEHHQLRRSKFVVSPECVCAACAVMFVLAMNEVLGGHYE